MNPVPSQRSSIPSFISAWLPPIALMIAIFLMSSRQSISVSDEHLINFIIFKSLHVIEYATLTFLLFRALLRTTTYKKFDILIVAVLLAVLYGFSDEIHQTFVPTRTGTLRDIGIDMLGIGAMYLFLRNSVLSLRGNSFTMKK